MCGVEPVSTILFVRRSFGLKKKPNSTVFFSSGQQPSKINSADNFVILIGFFLLNFLACVAKVGLVVGPQDFARRECMS